MTRAASHLALLCWVLGPRAGARRFIPTSDGGADGGEEEDWFSSVQDSLDTSTVSKIVLAVLTGIFVSMVLFLLIRIIASTLRSSDSTSAHQTLEHADTQAETVQEVYTVPSEHKVVINNYQVVINSCGCQQCRDCPDRE